MKLRLAPIMLVLLAMTARESCAQEVREFYNGVRSLGMGGVGIAVVNDETAVMVNPAALGKLRDSYKTIFDPEIDGGTNLGTFLQRESFSNPFDLEQVKKTTDGWRGKYFHSNFKLFPSYVTQNFGIGLLMNYTTDAEMNELGTVMKTFSRQDLGLMTGFNLRFFDGKIKFGFNIKAISRVEVDKDIDPTASLALKDNAKEGSGIGGDLGIILTAPVATLPTLSAVVRDAGGMSFTSGKGLRLSTAEQPVKVEQDVDVGLAIFPIHSNSVRSSIALEVKSLTAMGKAIDKSRFYHLGYELNLYDLVFLRAGLHQNTWTAGAEISSERWQLQLASYEEQIGTDGVSLRGDRRFVLKTGIRF